VNGTLGEGVAGSGDREMEGETMRKPVPALVLVLIVALLTTTGCAGLVKKGVEDATGVKVEGDKVTVTKDGETVEIGAAEKGKLPEGFPADYPMYEPITITSGVKATTNGTHFTLTADTAGTFDDVQKFYDERLKAAGWDVKTTGSAGAGGGVGSVLGTKGGDKTAVQIVQSGGGENVQIVLTLDVK
jgi:hypothetical protein